MFPFVFLLQVSPLNDLFPVQKIFRLHQVSLVRNLLLTLFSLMKDCEKNPEVNDKFW